MEESWYSKYYKERIDRYFSLKEAKKEEPVESKIKLTKEFSQELTKTNLPLPSSSRYLEYRRKELEKSGKPFYDTIVEKHSPKPAPKPVFKPYYSKPYYPFYSQLKTPIKLPEITKLLQGPFKVLSEVEKKLAPENLEINKTRIILGTLIIVLIILGGIYFFTQKNPETKLLPIDIITYNKTADSGIYYDGKFLFSLSGWETKLEYANQTDRLFGNEEYKKIIFDDKGKAYTVISSDNEVRLEPLNVNPEKATRIGWFTKPEEIFIKEKKSFTEKEIGLLLSSEQDYIKNSTIKHTIFKRKPYFKTEFSAGTENDSLLGEFSYGLIIHNYDIYLPTGEISVNNNQLISLNKSIDLTLVKDNNITKNISKDILESLSKKLDLSRKAYSRSGSYYEDNSDYQIFVDKNQTKAIIIYSPYTLLFQNSFYWNVYWVNVLKLEDGTYSPLYIILIDSPNLTYDKDKRDWMTNSRQYKGTIKSYIDEIIDEIGDKI